MSITIIIIVITVLISILAFSNSELFYKMDFNPYLAEKNKEWHRFISHALLHADWVHLLFNMLVLYFFGDTTQRHFESYIGAKGAFYFLLLYLGGVVFAVLPTFKKNKENPNYHSVGASGAVSAVLFSSVLFSPARELCLYGIDFLCFPGIIWAVIYLVYSYQKSKKSTDHINHDAHFWGAMFGVAFTLIAVPQSLSIFFDQILRLLPF